MEKLERLYPGVDFAFCSDEKTLDTGKKTKHRLLYAPLLKQGKLSYQCTILAMELFPEYEGFLNMGDDVLLNLKSLSLLDKKNMWIPKSGNIPDSKLEERHFSSSRPLEDDSRFALWHRLIPFGYLAAYSVENDISVDATYRKYLIKNGWTHTESDIFYFPTSSRDTFLNLARVFLRHQVYFSIAIPTIAKYITAEKKTSSLTRIKGKSLWGYDVDRQNWQRHLPYHGTNIKIHYYHPFKLSKLDVENSKQTDKVCAFVMG